MKKIFLFVMGICAFAWAKAQLSPDYPLYFSQYGINGTANYISRAGAIGAVGGDIMSSHYNPAGLGLYKKSEISFSSGINFNFNDSDIEGISTNDNRTSFNYGNFGMVGAIKTGSKGLKYMQFSFGVNKLRNFSNRMKMVRENVGSSFVDDVVMDAIVNNNDAENDFIRAGVVDLDSNGFISSIYESGTFGQIKSIKETGYLTEMSFSFSGNVDDRVYFGATLGIPLGYYKSTSMFAETRFHHIAKRRRGLIRISGGMRKRSIPNQGKGFEFEIHRFFCKTVYREPNKATNCQYYAHFFETAGQ